MAREDQALQGYYSTGGKAAGIMTTAATNNRDLCDYFLAAARARVLGRLVAVVGVDTAATAPASREGVSTSVAATSILAFLRVCLTASS